MLPRPLDRSIVGRPQASTYVSNRNNVLTSAQSSSPFVVRTVHVPIHYLRNENMASCEESKDITSSVEPFPTHVKVSYVQATPAMQKN